MKITTLLCMLLAMQCLMVSKAYPKDKTKKYNFKIVGSTKVTTNSGSKTVEYDTLSTDHLFILNFNKSGVLTSKSQELFTGKRFSLSEDYAFYANQKKIVTDGTTTYYKEDGSIQQTNYYQKGKLTLQAYYYANGQKELQIPGIEDNLNGEYKMWHQNGQLSFSGVYKNNLKEGTFTKYDELGNELKKGDYQNGKLVSGEIIVQDIEFDNPEILAKYPMGETAFDEYLTKKAMENGSIDVIAKYQKIFLDLKIDKSGKIVGIYNVSVSKPLEDEAIKDIFTDCPLLSPATVETVPVQSILSISLSLSGNGIKMRPEERIYQQLEIMPEFPGGKEASSSFIAANLRYPREAAESQIQGKVFVTFVVDVDGKITDVRIARGIHYLLDEEAVRVVKSMPNWTPGMINGKAVRVAYTVPINFRLN